MEHERFMAQALAQAALDAREVPVGAVVVKDNVVIARAHNERETERCDPFAHAEILAMRRAAEALHTRRLTGCTLYVTLEPCPMCAGAMVMAALSECVFGAFDARQGCAGSVYDIPQDPAFTHRVKCVGGVLEEECARLLRDFFAKKRCPRGAPPL